MVHKNDDFLYIIDQHDPEKPFLPVVHTTKVSELTSILHSKKIDVKKCKIFNKNVIYTFYGKPTYNVNNKITAPAKIVSRSSVCFVLDLVSLKDSIEKIHAFDTGGYHAERYEMFLPEGTELTDFELIPDIFSPAKFVKAFFGSNKEYYRGDVRTNLQIKPLDVVSEAIKNLGTSVVAPEFDERVASVEVTFKHAIELSKKTVRGIVAPERLGDDDRFTNACSVWGISPSYYISQRATDDARTGAICQLLYKYYQDRKWIT